MYLLQYMYHKNFNISQIWAPCPNIDSQNLELVIYNMWGDYVLNFFE